MTALGVAALPAAAQASTGSCNGSPTSQPFAQWGDNNYYELAPGGDFESSPVSWTLSGGASQVNGSDSFGATGTVGSYSLGLPAGSVAVSSPICVDAGYPDFRLFTASPTGGARIVVSVVYNTSFGRLTIPVGLVRPDSGWQPTAPMPTLSAIAGALHGGTADVSLQFAASGGTAQIDDVFVDPSGRCC
jgi:hypothetical protein